MNNNLLKLLKEIKTDKGNRINTLIKLKIIDIDDFISQVIELKNAEYIYLVSLYIKNANITKLADTLIEIKSPKYIYKFTINIHNLSNKTIDKLIDALIKAEDTEYIYKLAIKITNLSSELIDKLADALIEIKNPRYIYDFATNVHNLSSEQINKLLEAIIETKDFYFMYKFLLNVPNLTELQKEKIITSIIFEIHNINDFCKIAEYIYFYNLSYKLIEKMVDFAINEKNPEYISLLAVLIRENAPYSSDRLIELLADAIIETENLYYIRYFVKNVPNLSLILLEKINLAVENIRNKLYIQRNEEFMLSEMHYLISQGNYEELTRRREYFVSFFEDKEKGKKCRKKLPITSNKKSN